VALKTILPAGRAGTEDLARFQREAEAVAQIQYPNIVQIYEVGEQAGRPYFSLEFVGGGSLAQQLHGTPQPASPAAQLVEVLARAMQAVHQRGIVHRDLKPANILLQVVDDGAADSSAAVLLGPQTVVPKITDFGLAKRLEAVAGQTQTGAVLGTPSYMSPEQAAGKTRAIGPASDIYALGAILYEMITGRPPFKAETAWDTVLQVLSQEPIPPSRLSVNVPRDLETICLKCLRKEPGQRYSTARALADDLRCFLNHEPIQARPVTAWDRGVKWLRRRPAAVLASAVLLLVLGLLGIVLAPQLRQLAANEGELAVVTGDPRVELTVREQGNVRFERTRSTDFVLKAGDGSLDLYDSTATEPLLVRQFKIERGGRTVLDLRAELALARAAQPHIYAVQVPATQFWTATGVTLREGMEVEITATGLIEATPESDKRPFFHRVPPEGRAERVKQVPHPKLPALGMLGRIGEGPVFYVGAGSQFTVTASSGSGALFLGINDDVVEDNSGEWQAKITVRPGTSLPAAADPEK
jgi:hypothetical protein